MPENTVTASNVTLTRLDDDGTPVGDPVTMNATDVTLTRRLTEDDLVSGAQYLLDPAAKCGNDDEGDVYFNHTEPLLVRYDGTRGPFGVEVERLDGGYPLRQLVNAHWLTPAPVIEVTSETVQIGDRFRITRTSGGHGFAVGTIVEAATETRGGQVSRTNSLYVTTSDNLDGPTWQGGVSAWVSPWPSRTGSDTTPNAEFVDRPTQSEPEPATEPVAVHGSRPQWPIEPCVGQAHSVDEPHYHTIRGGVRDGWNMTVYESDYIHTVQGRRFGLVPSLGTPATATETANTPPPEEVLRLLEADPEQFEVEREQIRDLLTEVEQARAAVDAARRERAELLERIVERSRIVAHANEWCSVYDQGMRELGLPDRTDWEPPETEPERESIEVTATVEVSVPFDEDQFENWFRDEVSTDYGSIDSNTAYFTVNIDVSSEVTVDEGDCGCDEWDPTDHLPSWVDDNGFDTNIIETGCGNE